MKLLKSKAVIISTIGSIHISVAKAETTPNEELRRGIFARYGRTLIAGNISDDKVTNTFGLSYSITDTKPQKGEIFALDLEWLSSAAMSLSFSEMNAGKNPGLVLYPFQKINLIESNILVRSALDTNTWVSPFFGFGLGFSQLSQGVSANKDSSVSSFNFLFETGVQVLLPLGIGANLFYQVPFMDTFNELVLPSVCGHPEQRMGSLAQRGFHGNQEDARIHQRV